MVRNSASLVGKPCVAGRWPGAVLLIALSLPAWAVRFAPVEMPLPEAPAVVAVLDANGDEAPDLAVFPARGGPATLLSQTPRTGGWQAAPLQGCADATLAALAADVDNDLRSDLVLGCRDGAVVLRHDGRHGFHAPQRLEGGEPLAASTASLSAGDVNGDGLLDILESRSDGARGAVQLWLSTPVPKGEAPNWRAMRPLENGPWRDTTRVLLADLDGDGVLDLLAARRAGTLELFRGERGPPAKFEKRPHDLPGAWTHVDAGDVDNDGDLDLLLSGADRAASLYLNDGGFTFRGAANALPAVSASGVAPRFVDFDSDGRLDIAWSGAVILLQQDELRFRLDPEAVPLAADSACAIADLNGDGYPDLLPLAPGAGPRLYLQHPGPYHWLLVRLRGDAGRAVAGARITAKLPDGRATVRHLVLGDGVASGHAEGILLGIRRHTQVNTLEVHWLSERYTRLDEPLVKRPIGFIEPPASEPRQVSFANPMLEHLLRRKPGNAPQLCGRNYRLPGGPGTKKKNEGAAQKGQVPP